MRIVITGAASGIGRAAALRFASDARQRGGEMPRLLLADMKAPALEGVAAEVRALGAEATPFVGNLADAAVPDQMISAAVKAMGGIDVLVSNAGYIRNEPLLEMSLKNYELAFAVNTRATWLLAKAAHPWLKQSRGCLIATSSIAAEEPSPRQGAYSPSKAALLMFIRQLAIEWGEDGIRCNCVAPGPTHTAMTDAIYSDPVRRAERGTHIPLQRVGLAEDIAASIAFLASADASFITGINLMVDGGLQNTVMRSKPAAGSAPR